MNANGAIVNISKEFFTDLMLNYSKVSRKLPLLLLNPFAVIFEISFDADYNKFLMVLKVRHTHSKNRKRYNNIQDNRC